MPINLATYFDSRYLAKGLALIRSLARHLPDWRLNVLALDDMTFERIGELAATPLYRGGRLLVTPLRALESAMPDLRAAKQRRTWREYIFTLTPAWMVYILDRGGVDDLAYIDSDCYLYADLAPLYEEVGAASIGIIPHRWTPRHADRLRANGIYNVGWVYMRRDSAGLPCLDSWLSDCLAFDGQLGRFSDQVYLDKWPAWYGTACHIVEHHGANVAPWNQERYRFAVLADKTQAVHILDGSRVDAADGAMGIGTPRAWPLLWYHFHEFRVDPGGIYRTGYPLDQDVIELVYKPYEAEVLDAVRR